MFLMNLCKVEGEAAMELIEMILSQKNLEEAMKAVKSNKGAPGIDNMTVNEIDEYFKENMDEIKTSIMNKKYEPLPVRRVYIPKPNGTAVLFIIGTRRVLFPFRHIIVHNNSLICMNWRRTLSKHGRRISSVIVILHERIFSRQYRR